MSVHATAAVAAPGRFGVPGQAMLERYAALSDEVLVKEYQAGDGQAFAVLYQRYAGQVTGYFRRRMPDRPHDDHQDLAHEVFVLALAELGAWRDSGRDHAFRRWLFGGLARSVLQQEFRQRTCRRRVWLQEVTSYRRELADYSAPGAAADPATDSPAAGAGGELGGGLAALPAQHRRAVELRYLEGQSAATAAQIMGVHKSTLNEYLAAAAQQLRDPQGTRVRRATPEGTATRARVLEAGRQVLAERGPDALTVGAVARRAGVSRSRVYYDFTSRQGLLDALTAPCDSECAHPPAPRVTCADVLAWVGKAGPAGVRPGEVARALPEVNPGTLRHWLGRETRRGRLVRLAPGRYALADPQTAAPAVSASTAA